MLTEPGPGSPFALKFDVTIAEWVKLDKEVEEDDKGLLESYFCFAHCPYGC